MAEKSIEEEEREYNEYVVQAVEDGTYFKDAYSWYSIKYLNPIADRTFFAILSVLGIFIVFNLMMMINMVLPLVEITPIVLKEKDSVKYFPIVKDLSKDKKAVKGTDEAILKYLVENYVKERETHSYKTGDLQEYNLKLNRIKNTSSVEEYENFKRFMSKTNTASPIHFFGKDASRKAEITGFSFHRIKRQGIIANIKGFFQPEPIPLKANVYYTLTTQIGSTIKSEKRLAIIGFKFSSWEENDEYKMSFVVTEYKNYGL